MMDATGKSSRTVFEDARGALGHAQALLDLRSVMSPFTVAKASDFLDTMLRSTYTTANAPSGNQRYISRASVSLVGTRGACAGRRVRGSDPRRRNDRPDPARARLLRVGANRHTEVGR